MTLRATGVPRMDIIAVDTLGRSWTPPRDVDGFSNSAVIESEGLRGALRDNIRETLDVETLHKGLVKRSQVCRNPRIF